MSLNLDLWSTITIHYILNSDNSSGDPLDDLLGDFGSSAPSPSEDTSSEIEDSSVKMVDSDDLTSDFGESISSHSNRRKVRKVRKVKRSRKQP